jgi:hypothetical protein
MQITDRKRERVYCKVVKLVSSLRWTDQRGDENWHRAVIRGTSHHFLNFPLTMVIKGG